jgi:formylglycine-generating enzyme required for sulfatase activity
MARTTVTFEQYDLFATATERVLPQDEGLGRGAHPVINVDRQDMLEFINWLNASTGRHFRLPSEAEWEYAARAGTTSRYFWGDDPDPERANSSANADPDHFVYTAPVASFPPNAWGFYDMAGNVWQAVSDCLHANYVGAPIDGRAWVDPGCKIRMARGGYFGSRRAMGSASRAAIGEHFRSMGLGFRLAEDWSDAL